MPRTGGLLEITNCLQNAFDAMKSCHLFVLELLGWARLR